MISKCSNWRNPCALQPVFAVPSLAIRRKLKRNQTLISVDSDTKIISHFKYIKAKGSGTNIQGDKPNLLKLSNEHSNEHVKPLAYFIKENCIQDKFMVICNTGEMVELAKASLKTCDLSFIQYTDDIDGYPPKSTSLKKDILNGWQQDKDVLLVDCRGCRGMECQQVAIHLFLKNNKLLKELPFVRFFCLFQ